MSILPKRRRILNDPWLRRRYYPPGTTADTRLDHDDLTAQLIAGYGHDDYAGNPFLPDDMAERLQADLDHDARRAGGGE